jgi:short-subunit dehydrogenase
VLTFSEALWEENRPHGIHVMALCPGVTETNFFEAARGYKPPARVSQTPEEVVDTAIRALARGKSQVVSGWTNFLMIETERLLPRALITRLAGRMMRAQQEKSGK